MRFAITAERHTKFYRRTNRKAVYRYYRCGKKFGVCDQPYILAKAYENQMREIVFNYSLLPKNGQKLLEKLSIDEIKEKHLAKSKTKQLKFQLEIVDHKLQRLLDGYLEQVVDTKSYQAAKQNLLEQKVNLEEKLGRIRQHGSIWIEPMKDFIKGLMSQQKIAKAKNNCHDLAIVAKKLGSNFLLSNRRLKFSVNPAWRVLAAAPDAARAPLKNPQLCRKEN